MLILGFMGKVEAGKDTACDYFVEGFNARVLSFAEPLKDVCFSILNKSHGVPEECFWGTQAEKLADLSEYGLNGWSGRTICQHIGTEGFRAISPTVWTRYVKAIVKEFILSDPSELLVFSDVRFQTEVDAIHDLGGYVVRLTRDVNKGHNVGISNHTSESEMDGIVADYIIDNEGLTLDEFYLQLDNLAKFYGIADVAPEEVN